MVSQPLSFALGMIGNISKGLLWCSSTTFTDFCGSVQKSVSERPRSIFNNVFQLQSASPDISRTEIYVPLAPETPSKCHLEMLQPVKLPVMG